MEQLPNYIPVVFGLTTLLTLFLFYTTIKSSNEASTRSKANLVIFMLTGWIVLQSLLAYNHFYGTDTRSIPPKLFLAVIPMIITIIILFTTRAGRKFIDSLPLLHITWINIVRIPVELVLYWLAIFKTVPELMTFTGRNFDILSGITAPFIAYLAFNLQKPGTKILIAWNLVTLGLLLNIVVNAILSAPFVFQKFAFGQPNIAILYFPYVLLPAFIVPVILFGHLVSLRQLTRRKN